MTDTIKLAIVGVIALVLMGLAGYAGWSIRDTSADRAAAQVQAASQAEANRQAAINSNTEKYLREQLDLANAANANVHLGDVRCTVSVRNDNPLPTAASAATGPNGSTAEDDATTRTTGDIGPDLESWAKQLTIERERFRALQSFSAQQSGVKQ